MIVTTRDFDLIAPLCGPVRMLSWDQIRTGCPGFATGTASGLRATLRRLALLIERRLIVRHRLSVRPTLWPTAPMVCWSPGDAECDFDELARRLAKRWQEAPVSTSVYRATRRAVNLFGGVLRQRPAPGYQASHDLALSSVYLHYLRNRPDEVTLWKGEDELPRTRELSAGRKRPDAVLRKGKHVIRAIEFGAAYPADRLREFHADCADQSPPVPYEIW